MGSEHSGISIRPQIAFAGLLAGLISPNRAVSSDLHPLIKFLGNVGDSMGRPTRIETTIEDILARTNVNQSGRGLEHAQLYVNNTVKGFLGSR